MPNIDQLIAANKRIAELEKQQEAHDIMILVADKRVNSAMKDLNLAKQSNEALLRENKRLQNKLNKQ